MRLKSSVELFFSLWDDFLRARCYTAYRSTLTEEWREDRKCQKKRVVSIKESDTRRTVTRVPVGERFDFAPESMRSMPWSDSATKPRPAAITGLRHECQFGSINAPNWIVMAGSISPVSHSKTSQQWDCRWAHDYNCSLFSNYAAR